MVQANNNSDMDVDEDWGDENDNNDDGWGNDDDDDNDGWDDEEVGGIAEIDFTRKQSGLTSTAASNYNIIHVDQIRTALIDKLDEAIDLFALDRDDMMIIIRHYKWNIDKMQTQWFTNQETLVYTLGL